MLEHVRERDPLGAQLPGNGLQRAQPQAGRQEPLALLEQGVGEGDPAAVRDLGGQLLGLDQERAAEPLCLVELRHRGLALHAVAGDVGALLRLALGGLRAELGQPGAAGLEPGRLQADDGADIGGQGLDLLTQGLELGVGERTPLERELLLVEIRLVAVELGAGGPRLRRDHGSGSVGRGGGGGRGRRGRDLDRRDLDRRDLGLGWAWTWFRPAGGCCAHAAPRTRPDAIRAAPSHCRILVPVIRSVPSRVVDRPSSRIITAKSRLGVPEAQARRANDKAGRGISLGRPEHRRDAGGLSVRAWAPASRASSCPWSPDRPGCPGRRGSWNCCQSRWSNP